MDHTLKTNLLRTESLLPNQSSINPDVSSKVIKNFSCDLCNRHTDMCCQDLNMVEKLRIFTDNKEVYTAEMYDRSINITLNVPQVKNY